MKIGDVVSNVRIGDIVESILAAGYPMRTEEINYEDGIQEKDIKRMINLVKACEHDNQAHGQFLSGITVSFDLTFSNKAWVEAERYRFLTFVSSQSTMHRISKFELNKQYMEYVDPRMIDIMNELKDKYILSGSKEDYLKLLYSNPCGFKITARMTTNYRCLRNIYKQRKNHKLPEWITFCKWIETLPYAEELLIN